MGVCSSKTAAVSQEACDRGKTRRPLVEGRKPSGSGNLGCAAENNAAESSGVKNTPQEVNRPLDDDDERRRKTTTRSLMGVCISRTAAVSQDAGDAGKARAPREGRREPSGCGNLGFPTENNAAGSSSVESTPPKVNGVLDDKIKARDMPGQAVGIHEITTQQKVIDRNENTPQTGSVGKLDHVSSSVPLFDGSGPEEEQKEEFLNTVREQAEQWIESVYSTGRTENETQEGMLISSLPEDLFTLVGIHIRAACDQFSPASDTVVQAVCIIFVQLRLKHTENREFFFEDMRTCCIAANDFYRMSEKCEALVEEISNRSRLSADDRHLLQITSEELISLYNRDAVHAAEKVYSFVFEPIQEELGGNFFGNEWETRLTNNELALKMVQNLKRGMSDLEVFVESSLIHKTAESLIRASISFYFEQLLVKGSEHPRQRKPAFGNNERALMRIDGDIKVLREYAESLAGEMPVIRGVAEWEFETLTAVHELLTVAAGLSQSEVSDFVLVLQKHISNVEHTKLVVRYLWHLMDPRGERKMSTMVEGMEASLEMVARTTRDLDPLNEMLLRLSSKRKRRRKSSRVRSSQK